ncbi:hypothetical protein ACQKGI_01470 [Peribacillus muralis]|uniref:hypothetical protein n=1 Tax=Peribacillus muralis TaxID=264697 RepID=UPI0037F70E33
MASSTDLNEFDLKLIHAFKEAIDSQVEGIVDSFLSNDSACGNVNDPYAIFVQWSD